MLRDRIQCGKKEQLKKCQIRILRMLKVKNAAQTTDMNQMKSSYQPQKMENMTYIPRFPQV
jgi:hypothetical protein